MTLRQEMLKQQMTLTTAAAEADTAEETAEETDAE